MPEIGDTKTVQVSRYGNNYEMVMEWVAPGRWVFCKGQEPPKPPRKRKAKPKEPEPPKPEEPPDPKPKEEESFWGL